MAYNDNSEINFSRVIRLNDSAAFLIKSAEHNDFDLETWTQLLIDRFKIDQQRAQSDAEKLIDQLTRENIIE